MSLDPIMYRAFLDEMTKFGQGGVLSSVGNAGRQMGKWIGKGWHDPIGSGAKGWKWMGKGKYTRHLPIGGKSITVGLTSLAVPGALKKEDPYGMGRSRTERTTDLGASTVGGLAGTGALMSLPWKGWHGTRAIVGGVGGAMLAARLATMPWRRSRKKLQEKSTSEHPSQYSDVTYKGMPVSQGLSYNPWEQG